MQRLWQGEIGDPGVREAEPETEQGDRVAA
jgi:hypothetical protein